MLRLLCLLGFLSLFIGATTSAESSKAPGTNQAEAQAPQVSEERQSARS